MLSLDEAKAAWILGDWSRLAGIQALELEAAADREFLALLVGAACLRLGNDLKGRQFVQQAQHWGCPSRLIAQVIVAGVHFSLGRVELLRHAGQKSRQHVLAAIGAVSGGERADAQIPSDPGRPPDAYGAIPVIELRDLGSRLQADLNPPPPSTTPWEQWSMVPDDGPVLRYLFQAHQPRRHLEFGTWQGWGTCLCLEATAATVWTINLPDGEAKADGSWAYAERVANAAVPPGAQTVVYGDKLTGSIPYHRTDAGVYVGRLYRERGLGGRVCQIFCDSREWDTSCYPTNFFDSVFVDGGHQTDVVISDTRKGLSVLRPGGLILWHDFCPVPEVREHFPVVQEVTAILQALLPEIGSLFRCFGWIRPSMILFGIKR